MLGGWLVRMKGGSNSSSHSQPYLVLQVAPFRSSRMGRLGEDQLLSGELLRDSDVTMASRRPDQAHDSMAELRASADSETVLNVWDRASLLNASIASSPGPSGTRLAVGSLRP